MFCNKTDERLSTFDIKLKKFTKKLQVKFVCSGQGFLLFLPKIFKIYCQKCLL